MAAFLVLGIRYLVSSSWMLDWLVLLESVWLRFLVQGIRYEVSGSWMLDWFSA